MAALPATSGSDAAVDVITGRATGHGFEHGQAETFVQTRKREQPGGIVPER